MAIAHINRVKQGDQEAQLPTAPERGGCSVMNLWDISSCFSLALLSSEHLCRGQGEPSCTNPPPADACFPGQRQKAAHEIPLQESGPYLLAAPTGQRLCTKGHVTGRCDRVTRLWGWGRGAPVLLSCLPPEGAWTPPRVRLCPSFSLSAAPEVRALPAACPVGQPQPWASQQSGLRHT